MITGIVDVSRKKDQSAQRGRAGFFLKIIARRHTKEAL
jgi:hypothetical protein